MKRCGEFVFTTKLVGCNPQEMRAHPATFVQNNWSKNANVFLNFKKCKTTGMSLFAHDLMCTFFLQTRAVIGQVSVMDTGPNGEDIIWYTCLHTTVTQCLAKSYETHYTAVLPFLRTWEPGLTWAYKMKYVVVAYLFIVFHHSIRNAQTDLAEAHFWEKAGSSSMTQWFMLLLSMCQGMLT